MLWQQKCGHQAEMMRSVLNTPSVVSIGLIWDSEQTDIQHVRSFVQCIGTRLQLHDVSLCHCSVQCCVIDDEPETVATNWH